TDPHFFALFMDQIGFLGAGFVALSLLLIFVGAARAVINHGPLAGLAVLAPVAAYCVSFVILFTLFMANTYYAYNLLVALMFSLWLASELGFASPSKPAPKAFAPLTFAFVAVCGLLTLTPMGVIQPSAHPWSSIYVYTQLAHSEVECDPLQAR